MNEKLKELEAQVIDRSLAKLEELVDDYRQHKFLDNLDIKHLAEMVKLAHQIRSLLPSDPGPWPTKK